MIRMHHHRDLADCGGEPAEKACFGSVRMHHIKPFPFEQPEQLKERSRIVPRIEGRRQIWNRMKIISRSFRPIDPSTLGITSEMHFEASPVVPFSSAEGVILGAANYRKRYQM